jgi:hypothetical protein
MGGFANMQGGQDFMSGGPGNNAYDQGGFGPQSMSGNGYGGFSDGFAPPTQMFPQGDTSMLPPGSGAFPPMSDANGFPPSSQGFNAMYGMPGGDPFSPPQGGPPGYAGPPPNGGNFPAGGPNMMPPNQPGSPNSNWIQ